MLRRRTPKDKKNDPVTPDPIDPSTVPDARPPLPKEPISEKVRDLVPNLPQPANSPAGSEIAASEGATELAEVPDRPGPEANIAQETDTKAETEAPGGVQRSSEPPPEAVTPEIPEVLEASEPEIPEPQLPDTSAIAEAAEAAEADVPPLAAAAVPPPAAPSPPPAIPPQLASISTPLESETPVTPPLSPIKLEVEARAATLVGGIDLGGTKIAAAIVGSGHEIIAYRRRPTPSTGGPSDVVRAMTLTIQEAAQDAGIEAHMLRAVGVGSPGSVESATGAVSDAGNLPGWDGRFPLANAMRDMIGTSVVVGNDVQVGTNAEYLLGAGAGYRSLLGVFWGTGVGGGIVLDGKPWRGRGRAGEIGHTIVRRGGAPNSNGLDGTVEAYAGRKAMQAKAEREMEKGRKSDLFRIMEKHGKTNLTSAIWAHARDHGDELTIELLARAVKAMSAGIASAINLLDVEAVVIGGGMGVRFADSLVPEIIAGMEQYLLNKDNPPSVKAAGLGDEGGVIGASLLVS